MKAPDGVIDIFLQPGDYYFGDESTRIRTILGSCVSITLWHPWKRIGGMCHFMLPQRAQRGDEFHGKYADEVLELLLKQVRLHKTHPGDYQIKLFGGGDMFPGRPSRGESISRRNIQAARQFLDQYNMKPISENVGASGHRNVIFEVWSGNVWVRHQPIREVN
ncbi:chemotaxis protein CheD [Saccharophagus sp. K07]|uniref:chemotaxis protein CheD n=1 Tax=Saccharophagus sp. K07 TaxID=2283636 RepID=UPI001651E607|nr:chemotaxis protein CheD [Saccharophagus sp. K07]MBC6905525.1 chemotaxis protein CheD [Saccharophagus sp. K07]